MLSPINSAPNLSNSSQDVQNQSSDFSLESKIPVNIGLTHDSRAVEHVPYTHTPITIDNSCKHKRKQLDSRMVTQLNPSKNNQTSFEKLDHSLFGDRSLLNDASSILAILNGLFPNKQEPFQALKGFSKSSKALITLTLLEAAGRGYTAVVEALLDRGADVNAMDATGMTALLTSSVMGKCPMIQLLLERGAFIEGSKRTGSPLLHAACHGRLNAVQLLLQHKADINYKTVTGNSILMNVQSINRIAACMLIQAGADVNVQNIIGWTALMQATADNDLKLIELLLDAGALIDTVDFLNHKTALMYAVCSKNMAVAQFLVARGANKDLKDRSDKTAWMLAAQHSEDASFIEAINALLS